MPDLLDRRERIRMNKQSFGSFRLRVAFAVLLISASLICMLFALTQKQILAARKCWDDSQKCKIGCNGEGDYDDCVSECAGYYQDCMHAAKIPGYLPIGPSGTPTPRPGPSATAPPNKSHPTPTPRPGPSATAPPNKSNPTPKPRKGPGKIGTTGIGKASPTPSPKGPVLLEKSGKPSPTPRPTPRKHDDHQDHHNG
jgi:hypothetical protein